MVNPAAASLSALDFLHIAPQNQFLTGQRYGR